LRPNRACAQTTHEALPWQSCRVKWGPGRRH